MDAIQTRRRNGIDLDLMDYYVGGMRGPEKWLCTARSRHRWIDAFAVEGYIDQSEEGGETQIRAHHRFRTDWPPPFSGDSGMIPGLEMLLGAVANCAATTCIAKATLRGISIDELEAVAEASVDVRGVFEAAGAARPGWPAVHVTLHIRSQADDETLRSLVQNVRATSPALDTIENPVPLQLDLQRMQEANTQSR
jgi:uncharacterized OsmC-like protein